MNRFTPPGRFVGFVQVLFRLLLHEFLLSRLVTGPTSRGTFGRPESVGCVAPQANIVQVFFLSSVILTMGSGCACGSDRRISGGSDAGRFVAGRSVAKRNSGGSTGGDFDETRFVEGGEDGRSSMEEEMFFWKSASECGAGEKDEEEDEEEPEEVCRLPEPFIGAGGWGKPLGKFKQTFYWTALERESSGGSLVEIYDQRGRVIAKVPLDFACELGVEGSGMLADGRVVNYWGAGDRCVKTTVCRRPHYPSRNCYQVLNQERYPWGKGVRRRSLIPYLSLATDPHVVSFGTIIYLPAWDGYVLPDGSVHDGCFRSDDTGGAIIEDHIDFFSGKKSEWLQMKNHFPKSVEVYIDPPRCSDINEWYDAVGAGCCDDVDCSYAGGVCLGDLYFPGGYCSLESCRGGDCPDVGGYFAFCTDFFTGGTCVARCMEDEDCRRGYVCREVRDLAGGTGMACIPEH